MTTPPTSAVTPPAPPLALDALSAALDAVERPIAEAAGLPNAAYTEPAFHAFERAHLFANTWSALAFCADHRAAGVVTPVDFMGVPLIVVSDPNGCPAVFHNVCSHRGTRLVTEPKKTNGLLVCPYHAWAYSLDGGLKATPHIGGVGKHQADGFHREQHGLKAVRSHCWLGVLFINLSADAPEFGEYAAPLTARYRDYIGDAIDSADAFHPTATDAGLTLEANCNWKLAVENYCEAYHLPWVHPGLNDYSPLARHYGMLISDDFAGQGTDTFAPALGGDALPDFPAWPPERHEVAEYPTFYPNLLLGFQRNHIFALIIQPLAVDRVREALRLFYVGEGANADRHAAARHANLNAWRKVFSEDICAIEGMQRGRHSPGFTGGVFSPALDAPTHHFHRWVARKYRVGLG